LEGHVKSVTTVWSVLNFFPSLSFLCRFPFLSNPSRCLPIPRHIALAKRFHHHPNHHELSRTDSSSSSFEQNSWSHNSRYLLTASRDWNVIIWDLSSAAFSTVIGERRNTIRFDAPVTSAALHPTNSFVPPSSLVTPFLLIR